MTDLLTIDDAVALGQIIGYAQRTAKVAILIEGGDILFGQARHICKDESGNFIHNDVDVREGFLRITMQSGFERFYRVRELIELYKSQHFTAYDW